MIDFVRGTVVYHESDSVAVDVGGTGYRVFVTNPVQWEEGREVMLYTHHVVREDAQLLFGFASRRERDLFRVLLEVSGVGPKAAIGMLTVCAPADLVRAIEFEDMKTLTRLPGVGKKTAQRLVLELKDKLKKAGFVSASMRDDGTGSRAESVGTDAPGIADVIAALSALGYNEEEAGEAARLALETGGGESLSLEEWIRRALQQSLRK
ncbi:Holliday junction branch migration protein RuvA [Staphylospora marina]|uniref:Holliday junction branch migration protein RuvA n=1 Tax=Staphylospora marina TaxID=2490858 RepID=UPI000F5C0CA6|nr:Holliday junction branch migration protein RuvA [Staphylospora marina]